MIYDQVRKIKRNIFDNVELDITEFLIPFSEVWWKINDNTEKKVWILICPSCKRKMTEILGDKKYDE
jgi:hypothetical protein